MEKEIIKKLKEDERTSFLFEENFNVAKNIIKVIEECSCDNPIMEINKKLEWGKTAEKQMDFYDAKKWCESQGDGWRMPELDELELAYKNKIKGFKSAYYWSATENNAYNSWYQNSWYQSFADGRHNYNSKRNTYYVRLVRDIK